MARIVIEVDDTTARKWKFTSSQNKKDMSKKIDQLLQAVLTGDKDDFWEFVSAIREEAKANGLTEEELNRILDEE